MTDDQFRSLSVVALYVVVFATFGSTLGTPISGDEPATRYVLVGLWWAVPLWVYVSAERSPGALVVSAAYLIVSLLLLNQILGADDAQGEGFGFAFMPIYFAFALLAIAGATKVLRWADARSDARPRPEDDDW